MSLLYKTALLSALLILGNLCYGQWDIDDDYLFTGTDLNGNTHDIQSYLDNGQPVFLMILNHPNPSSWSTYESVDLAGLYNQYGQAGNEDVVVLFVAGYGFDTEADLSGIDYSSTLGPGYEDLDYLEDNPVPFILSADNSDVSEFIEWGGLAILCPEGEMYGTGSGSAEELMDLVYSNCCTDLETYDPALELGQSENATDCNPDNFDYIISNESTFDFSSCNVDVYINGTFEEQFEITETIGGCSSLELTYENENIEGGDEVLLAIADGNDQLFNDSLYFQTSPVDTIGSHIKAELINPGNDYLTTYVGITGNQGGNSVVLNSQSNFNGHLFADPGCQRLTISTYEDFEFSDDTLLVGSVDESGNYTDTLIFTNISNFWASENQFNIFVEGEAVDQQIWGYVFEDENMTSAFHPDLPRIQGVQVDHGSLTTFTNADGYYNFEETEPVENIEISYDESTWPVYTTPDAVSWDYNNFMHNFGLNSDDPVWELSSSFDFGLPYICEAGISQYISIHNTGNQPATGEVVFTHDPQLTPVNIYPDPIDINGNVLTFDIPEVQYGGFFSILIQYEDVSADLTGENVIAELEITTFDDSGTSVGTMSDSVSDTLFCSYDPNDIYGFPLGIGEQGFISADTSLKYRVRFQNTGNYPATNVVVVDTLPEELDWDSFSPGAATHDYSVTMDQDTRAITWTFNNIMLPDSASNPEESIGQFWFDVELNNLDEGDQIHNTAYIYFDQNEAVITNTSLHTIAETVSVREYKETGFSIFPNPVSKMLHIAGENILNKTVELRDMQGRTVRQWNANSNHIELSISSVPAGVYLINVSTIPGVQKVVISR